MQLIPRDVGGRFGSPDPQFTSWPARWHVLGTETEVVPGRRLDIRQFSTAKVVTVTVGTIVAQRVVGRREGPSVRFVVAEIEENA